MKISTPRTQNVVDNVEFSVFSLLDLKMKLYVCALIIMAAIIGCTNAANCFEKVAGEGVPCDNDGECLLCDNYPDSKCMYGTCTGTVSFIRKKRSGEQIMA